MNLTDKLLPAQWYWFGHTLLAIILIKVAQTKPWQRLDNPKELNIGLAPLMVRVVFRINERANLDRFNIILQD